MRSAALPLALALAWPLASAAQELDTAASHADLSGSYPGAGASPTLHVLQGQSDLLVSFSASWGTGGSHLCYCLARAEKRGPGQWKLSAPLDGTLQLTNGGLHFSLAKPSCCSEDFPGLPAYALSTRKAPRSCRVTQRAYLSDLEGKATQEEVIRGDVLDVVPAPDDRSDTVVVRLGKRKKLGLLSVQDVDCEGK